jgi:mono/diheme cytochrome c family protein
VALSQRTFEAQVQPLLTANCASCHQARGAGATGIASSFRQNRFVLTGSPEGDYNVTLSMISDTCRAASNYLLSRPSTVPHPAGATTQTNAVLPVGSAGYTQIANWIGTGCGTP